MQKNSYLITGGTGSFGNAFIKKLINPKKISKLIIFSRDELNNLLWRLCILKKNINLSDFF